MGEDIEEKSDEERVGEAVVEEEEIEGGEDGVNGVGQEVSMDDGVQEVEGDGSMEVEDAVQEDEIVEATEEEMEVQERLRAHVSVSIEDSLGSHHDLEAEEEYAQGLYPEAEEGGMSSNLDESTEEMSLDQVADALHGPGVTYDIPILNLSSNRERGHRDVLQQEHHGRALTDRPSMRRSEWDDDDDDDDDDEDQVWGSSERRTGRDGRGGLVGLGRSALGRHDFSGGSMTAEKRSAAWQRPIVGFDVRPSVGQKVIGRVGHPEVRYGIGTIMSVSKDGGISTVRWEAERGNMREPMQYPSGSFGQYSLELCAPPDLMVGGRYVPSDNPVMFPNKKWLSLSKARINSKATNSQAGDSKAAGDASWADSTVRAQPIAQAASIPALQRNMSIVSSSSKAVPVSLDSVPPIKSESLRLEEERHIIYSLFVRFAAGMTRKRFNGYDPRSLVKQKIESMNLSELLLVLEVLHPRSIPPYLPRMTNLFLGQVIGFSPFSPSPRNP